MKPPRTFIREFPKYFTSVNDLPDKYLIRFTKKDPATSPTLRQLFIKQDRHRSISKKTKYLNAK